MSVYVVGRDSEWLEAGSPARLYLRSTGREIVFLPTSTAGPAPRPVTFYQLEWSPCVRVEAQQYVNLVDAIAAALEYGGAVYLTTSGLRVE